jgi:hypothetical protein
MKLSLFQKKKWLWSGENIKLVATHRIAKEDSKN